MSKNVGEAPKMSPWRECEHGEYEIECGRDHFHAYAPDSLPGMRGGSNSTLCGMSLGAADPFALTSDMRLVTCRDCQSATFDWGLTP